MTVLDHLVEEHRKTEEMIAKLEQAGPGATRAFLLAELSDSLDVHMEVEERDIYPIVQQHLGGDRSNEAEREHDEARDILSELADRLEADDFLATLESLKDAIKHHVAEEEHEIFPALRKRAAAEIEALGDPEQVEDEVKEALSEEAPAKS